MLEPRKECNFDVASGPFKCSGDALMWPRGTLKKSLERVQIFS